MHATSYSAHCYEIQEGPCFFDRFDDSLDSDFEEHISTAIECKSVDKSTLFSPGAYYTHVDDFYEETISPSDSESSNDAGGDYFFRLSAPALQTELTFGGITYTVDGVLGSGGGGQVVHALSSLGGQVAIKICSKDPSAYPKQLKLTASELRGLVMNERDILVKTTSGEHPFLTQPLACFQDDNNVYFVMRLYVQNLAELIFPAKPQPLNRQHVKLFAAELLLGLQSLHNLNIVHRDLKPDNILITSSGHIAVADFGLAKHFPAGAEMAMSECLGTYGYYAPEVMGTGGYTGAVDIWGYGIILYEMLLGRRCCNGATSENQMFLNMELPHTIHQDIDTCLGDSDTVAADLLHAILQVDPTQRPSWAVIQQHAYFTGVDWEEISARGLECDVPLPAWGGLMPYLPSKTIEGVKFEVSDDLLNFGDVKSHCPYSAIVHGLFCCN